MTFSLMPSSLSALPEMAASLSTLEVSWKEAAEMKPRVCSAAFVIPVSYTHLTLPTNREV